jgi:hypothetical protein
MSLRRLYSRQESLRIALAVAYPSSMTSDHQPRELIDCAAGDYLMQAALFRGLNLDLARVIGVFDSAVRIPRAKPLLRRPAVEGIATLPGQNRSNNPFSSIPLPFGRSITLY